MRLHFLWILPVLFIVSCSRKGELVHITGKTMGTTYNIKYHPYKDAYDRILMVKKINQVLDKVNGDMSTYRKDSQITFFNKHQLPNDWMKMSPNFYKVASHAINMAKLTDGAFDPTIGPLVNLWGFGPDGKRKVPRKSDIDKARMAVGFEKIELAKKPFRIKKSIPGVYLDLSASAKGFGVDVVAEFLEKQGIEDYMVEIGGEVKTHGQVEGRVWKIGIEAPHPEKIKKRFTRILPIVNQAVATSGDYRNFFDQDGKHYSHAIDFRTGKPVAHTLASVTVVDPNSCMRADSLATALMVMGPLKGMEFAENQGLAAYFIYKLSGQKSEHFVEKASTKFKQYFPGIVP